jgi:hypothetical protein
VSPRIAPKSLPPDVVAGEAQSRRDAARLAAGGLDPYRLQHRPHECYDIKRADYVPAAPPDPAVPVPSFWYDLVLERDAEQRVQQGLSRRGRPSSTPVADPRSHAMATWSSWRRDAPPRWVPMLGRRALRRSFRACLAGSLSPPASGKTWAPTRMRTRSS